MKFDYKYNNKNSKDCYVYAHFRKDKNEPFYIGIGSRPDFKRAIESYGRNKIWERIALKADCDSRVLYTNLSWEEACEIEINLISHFGRIDLGTGILANMTDGGEGGRMHIVTEELRIKISERVKNAFLNKGGNGWLGKKHSQQTIDKMSGRVFTDTWRKNISKSLIGRPGNVTNSVKVIDNKTGEIYDNIKQAAIKIGVNYNTLHAKLKGRIKNNTSISYVEAAN